MAYPTNNNNRVFYATQAVAIGDRAATGVTDSPAQGSTKDGSNHVMVAHGVQSIGISTNFNLEAIFELGQLALYENYEEIPEIEVTFEKLLDGYSLLYHLGTVDSSSPTLTGRQNARSDVRMAVGMDDKDYMSTGVKQTGVAELYCSGMYVSSVSYNLGTDGSFTESTTFVGNDKQWVTASETAGNLLTNDNGVLHAAFGNSLFGSDAPTAGSVLRRQNIVIGSGGMNLNPGESYSASTEVPNVIEGGSAGSLTNTKYIIEGSGPYIQSLSISADLGREAINQLGKKAPYFRYVTFPVDVTCDIEVTAIGTDTVDAAEESTNLSDHSIQIVLDDSTVIQLGQKNKLASVSFGGGDAGGGNATISYSFTNSNDLAVMHSGDPAPIAAEDYWKNHFA
jgi:hypothetical protein